MKYIVLVIIFLSISAYINDELFAQENANLTGSLYSDSRFIMKDYKLNELPQVFYPVNGRKSVLLAGALSVVVPGAGEIYSGEYIKGAAFLLLEAAAIWVAVEYNQKGDNQTSYFQKVADESWSVVKYAEWLNANHQANISINPDASLKPWERVNWRELNDAEVGSHHLPPYGDQQYYELIGKYHQFSPGWNDFTGGTGPAPNPTPNFIAYSIMRGDANDLYDISSKAVIVIFANHILSTLDAIWSASSFNKNLAFDLKLQESNYAFNKELSPVLNMRYSF